jgi:hypothetical protein
MHCIPLRAATISHDRNSEEEMLCIIQSGFEFHPFSTSLCHAQHKYERRIRTRLKLLFTGMVLFFLFSCKSGENGAADSKAIDVEHALQNITRLKVSDFGRTVRYIPLETTDDGLVGGSPIVKVLRNHIVVEFRPGHCLLFDKENGRFVAEIGHQGQDPEAFTGSFSWTDEREEFLYFERRPSQLIKYDMEGNFCGKTEFSPSEIASFYLITDEEIIGYFDGLNSTGQWLLGLFDREGHLKDTVPPLYPRAHVVPDEVAGVSILRGSATRYGNWTRTGAVIINYKNDAKQIIAPNAARMWKNSGQIRLKEDFADTLYTVSAGGRLIPSIVFHTGEYHWPVEEKMSKKHGSERIFISDVSENNSFIFFQCILGLYTDNPVLYNGLYDKETGVTKLGRHSDGIEDDVTRFMPFSPLGLSTAGEFVSLVEAGDVMEWLEKHPEAIDNEQLSFLKELDEDKNPVVILVE